jgi:hypothetical protein
MDYQSSRTSQILVETVGKFPQKFLTPVFRAIRKTAADLGLSADDVRFVIDTDGESRCCYLGDKKSLININIDMMIYGYAADEYVGVEKAYEIIAHEMRHAWQYKTGVLEQTETHFIWNGVLYPRSQAYHWADVMFNDDKWEAYLTSPWEEDAREYSGEDE